MFSQKATCGIFSGEGKMAQLTKGMYGGEILAKRGLFGLRCGQCRGDDFVHNGGWYNRAGEKLGFGDLAPADFLEVSNNLEDGEMFIILSESDSFWKFVYRPGLIGSMAAVKPDVEAPGVEYVAEHAMYVIARHQFYFVDRYGRKEGVVTMGGLDFGVISKEEVNQLIAG